MRIQELPGFHASMSYQHVIVFVAVTRQVSIRLFLELAAGFRAIC